MLLRVRSLGLLLGLAVAAPVPTPIGAGPRYHPPAAPKRILQGRAVGPLRCGAGGGRVAGPLPPFPRLGTTPCPRRGPPLPPPAAARRCALTSAAAGGAGASTRSPCGGTPRS